MVTRGLSERRALAAVRMSASALRYVPRPDQDAELRDRIVALAHRHRRYGAGMIYLKLRQEGRVVNHKRVDRLYAEARLQVSADAGRKCRCRTVSRWYAPDTSIKSGRPTLSSIARRRGAS